MLSALTMASSDHASSDGHHLMRFSGVSVMPLQAVCASPAFLLSPHMRARIEGPGAWRHMLALACHAAGR